MAAFITSSSVLCAGGGGTEQLWATVRAKISCIKSSSVVNRYFEPIQMGLVPEDALAPLPPELDAEPLPSSARRMLQLAGPTLAAAAHAATSSPVTVYLGLPQVNITDAPWLGKFLRHLGVAASVPIDLACSRIFPKGRAAALLALEAAMQRIAHDPSAVVLVGGVDTYLDLRRIAILDSEARILGPQVMDGFLPGEGAAFVVVKGPGTKHEGPNAPVVLQGVAAVDDVGHRYGTAPALGEGLANAMDKLRAELPAGQPRIASTFAGFNGENFEAKLWGVARLRHNDFFARDMVMQHPADSIGDTGAGAGAILTALAAFAISRRQSENSTLVWAASDHESRGCALLSTEIR